MRTVDAPPPGWYPDPQGGVRLRWWDGTDWTVRYRSRPAPGATAAAASAAAAAASWRHSPATPTPPSVGPPLHGAVWSAAEAAAERERLVSEFRHVARAEAQRAADAVGSRVQRAVGNAQPLVSDYASKLLRWIRLAAIAVVLAVVVWLALEVVARWGVAEWIGDRIDNLTDSSS